MLASPLISHPSYFYNTSQKYSELVQGGTNDDGEVESGEDGLEHSDSPKLNRIQKIISSAQSISGPSVRVGYHQNVDMCHATLPLC